MKNCIYFFTGTGNCLKLARDIAERLPDCELIAIKKGISITVPSGCERIGFVYPVYYLGLPAMVADFLKRADFPGQDQTYYFAVATYGEFAGNSIPELNRLLMNKGIILNYGAVLKMFSNCVTMYNMRKNVAEITGQSKQRSGPVIQAICEREYQPASGFGRVVDCYHRLQISRVRLISRSFQVSRDCVSCGICRKVCAAENISFQQGKPVFLDRCEHCTACIQHCPQKAINYKKRTQKRRRYTHPEVGYQMIAGYYKTC